MSNNIISSSNSPSPNSSIIHSTFDKIKQNKPLFQGIIFIVVIGLTISFCIMIKSIVVYLYRQKMRKPWIIKGSKDAKKSLIVAQNPADPNSVPLNRSDNESGGTEFTYSLWMVVDNFVYNKDKWKHVFHKGNNPPYPNRSPGVYLHPNKNSLRIYMNTYEKILDYIDIDNIPVRKWIHLAIVLKEKTFDIYVNGTLKKRHIFNSLPRQNFGDLWVNLNGGFEGYLSRMRYYQYALEYDEIEDIVSNGPSDDTCGDSKDLPGYLNDRWWIKN